MQNVAVSREVPGYLYSLPSDTLHRRHNSYYFMVTAEFWLRSKFGRVHYHRGRAGSITEREREKVCSVWYGEGASYPAQ